MYRLPWHRKRAADAHNLWERRANRFARKQHSLGASLCLEWQQTLSTFHHDIGSALGSPPDNRHGRSKILTLQPEVRLRQDAPAGWLELGRRAAHRLPALARP